MVDEAKLRDDFLRQKRNDTAWTALSNVVLALGSIAAGDDNSHMLYYARAQGALGYNIFTSGNLEILQALILLSSMYLHYLNSPNTAYLVMGTAVRMGVAMGLHREWGKQRGRAQSSVGLCTNSSSSRITTQDLVVSCLHGRGHKGYYYSVPDLSGGIY